MKLSASAHSRPSQSNSPITRFFPSKDVILVNLAFLFYEWDKQYII